MTIVELSGERVNYLILRKAHAGLTLYPPVPNIFGFSFFYNHIMYHILTMLNIKCDIKSARFKNSLPPFCQI